MKPRILFILGGAALIGYGVFARYFIFSARTLASLNSFGDMFRQLSLMVSLLILLGAISGSALKSTQAEMEPLRAARVWWIGFVTMLLVALGLAIIVNPHARFSGNAFPPVNVGARKIKVDLYAGLQSPPNLVVMGSSRAFTISPSYIQKETGYSAFNMAVESGDAGDYYIQTNYMVKTDTSPRVMVIEIHQNSFGGVDKTWQIQPLALIPYMPLRGVVSLSEESLKDAFGLQSISDSLYSLFLSEAQRQTWTINLDPYGMGIRAPITPEEYKKLLTATITGPTKNNVYCKRLAADGKKTLEAMAALAEKNGIGIVLYESPMNFTFSNTTYEEHPDAFDNCRNLLNSYLFSLSESYPNVFFRDLSVYEPISKLRENGYYDAVHLMPNAAEMVVDALIPEIESAMEWSLKESAK
jgi:hypothetical protein